MAMIRKVFTSPEGVAVGVTGFLTCNLSGAKSVKIVAVSFVVENSSVSNLDVMLGFCDPQSGDYLYLAASATAPFAAGNDGDAYCAINLPHFEGSVPSDHCHLPLPDLTFTTPIEVRAKLSPPTAGATVSKLRVYTHWTP